MLNLSVMAAYEQACEVLGMLIHEGAHPAGHYINANNELKRIKGGLPAESTPTVDALPSLGGKPCLEHREKTHQFADGSIKKCCSATTCMWGQRVGDSFRKRHSDTIRGGTLYSAEVFDAPESEEIDQSSDEVQELTVPTFVKGDDGPNEEDLMMGEAVERAEQEDDGYEGEDE